MGRGWERLRLRCRALAVGGTAALLSACGDTGGGSSTAAGEGSGNGGDAALNTTDDTSGTTSGAGDSGAGDSGAGDSTTSSGGAGGAGGSAGSSSAAGGTANTATASGMGGTAGTADGSATGGVGGTGGSAGSGGSAGTTGCSELELECTSNQRFVSRRNALIVLDKSGSMEHAVDNQRKWSVVISAITSELPGFQGAINFGLELFPFTDSGAPIDRENCGRDLNCCEMPGHAEMNVPIVAGQGSAQVARINEVLNATDPGGGTPTTVALERALGYFHDGDGANLPGESYVLLITDGGPNCNDTITCGTESCTYNLDNPSIDCSQEPDNNCCNMVPEGCVDASNTIERINELRSIGVDTFVVGLPGTEIYAALLDDFAAAGGRPLTGGDTAYYRVDDSGELTGVLSAIAADISDGVDCTLTLDTAPEAPPVVAAECEPVTPDEWSWEAGSTELTLGAALCERAGAGERVDVLIGCASSE